MTMTLQTLLQIMTIFLIVFVPVVLYRTQPSKWTVIGCVIYTASYFISNIWHLAFWTLDPPMAYGFALRVYQAGTLLLVAMYAGTVFYALLTGIRLDLQAKLVWLVLFIAEAFAILEYAECKMLTDPFGSGDLLLSEVWGIEVSRFACGRTFGAIAPYVAPIVTSVYVIWINTKAWRQRKSESGDD